MAKNPIEELLDDLCEQAGPDGLPITIFFRAGGPAQGAMRFATKPDGTRRPGLYELLAQGMVGDPRRPDSKAVLLDNFFTAEAVERVIFVKDTEQPAIVQPKKGLLIPT